MEVRAWTNVARTPNITSAERRRANRTRGRAWCTRRAACCVMLVGSLLAATGCSTATAAGCAVGTLTGMAVAMGATAGTELNAGQALLGGGIFGITSGCAAAATADALASPSRNSRDRRERRPPKEPENADLPGAQSALPTTPSTRVAGGLEPVGGGMAAEASDASESRRAERF